MKINAKILSIPPYISTSWDNVLSLQMDASGMNLIVSLKTGTSVTVPNLPGETLDMIFRSHAEFVEATQSVSVTPPLSGGFPMGMDPSGLRIEGIGNFTGMMQHDPNQKDAPPLPQEILAKVSGVAKAMGLDLAAFNLPESEPHCNCPFCQISRAMSGEEASVENNNPESEEEIADSELEFRDWDVKQVGEKLYTVTNRINHDEHYQVFLGTPIGCTCGQNNCDHIIAVLNS